MDLKFELADIFTTETGVYGIVISLQVQVQ